MVSFKRNGFFCIKLCVCGEHEIYSRILLFSHSLGGDQHRGRQQRQREQDDGCAHQLQSGRGEVVTMAVFTVTTQHAHFLVTFFLWLSYMSSRLLVNINLKPLSDIVYPWQNCLAWMWRWRWWWVLRKLMWKQSGIEVICRFSSIMQCSVWTVWSCLMCTI